MSPVTQRTRTHARGRGRRKTKSGWQKGLLIFWPLLLGILITPLAVWGASVLAMSGPSALRLLYPYVTLAQGHAQSFASAQQETLTQWVMYGQFPIYGLVWVMMGRLTKGAAGALSALLLHCVGVAAAVLNANG